MLKARKILLSLTLVLASGISLSNASAAVPTVEEQQIRTANEAVAEWKDWVNDHAYKLTSIQRTTDFDDLEMLKPLLHDKRMVFLGESSHGVAEFSLAKTRLIQFLHQEMDFNVLAFESGLGNIMDAYGNIDQQSAEQTMKEAIFGVWWTKETLPLFDYIKASQTTDQPLSLVGFDMQLQGMFTNGDWLQNKQLAKQFLTVEEQLVDWSSSEDIEGYRQAKPKLITVYTDVKSQVKQQEQVLKAAYPNEPHIVKLMERTLAQRIHVAEEYIELNIQSNIELKQNNPTTFYKTMEWRDQAMVENLLWLANDVYPNEKFIVWAHNDHIRKAHSEVMGTPYSVKMMGELLPEAKKKSSYVLGLYMGSGESVSNARDVLPVLPVKRGSMEDILAAANAPYTFIDMRYRQNERGNSWMFEPRLSYSWGLIEESFVPQEQYDGILLIDKATQPTYIK